MKLPSLPPPSIPRWSAPLALLTLSVILVNASGCGTYSQIRTGRTLPAGGVELNAGVAANQIGEVNPVAQGAVGLSDRVELVGHYELWNGYGELRAGLLRQEMHGIDVAIGAGAGFGTTFVNAVNESELFTDENRRSDGLLTASLVVSHRFGEHLELYLSGRTVYLIPENWVNSGHLGVRIGGRYVHVFAEGGIAAHDDWAVLGEGAAGLGVNFGG